MFFLNAGCLLVPRHEQNGDGAVFLNTGCLLVPRCEQGGDGAVF